MQNVSTTEGQKAAESIRLWKGFPALQVRFDFNFPAFHEGREDTQVFERRLTVNPCACSRRAQWWAPLQDSIPIWQPGSTVSSNTLSQFLRESRRRHTGFS